MYQIAMVEDEADAHDALQRHLDRYAAERGEAFSVTWYTSAVEFQESHRVFDLIFLDIELPGINGMEAAQLLRVMDVETPIIFVTNLAQYAVRGYEVDALDFIVKPVQYMNFRMRMDKAMRHLRRNSGQQVVLSTREDIRVVALADIEYVEVSKHDLSYHLWGEEAPFVVYGSLKAFEEEVAGGPFVRISSSCLANMNHVRSVRGGELVMSGGDVLYFSRSRKRPAMETIANFLGGSI